MSELLQVRLGLLDILLTYLYGDFFLTLAVCSGFHLLSTSGSLILDQTRNSVDNFLFLDLDNDLISPEGY